MLETIKYITMNTKFIFLLMSLMFTCVSIKAQETEKSDLQKRAEAIDPQRKLLQRGFRLVTSC